MSVSRGGQSFGEQQTGVLPDIAGVIRGNDQVRSRSVQEDRHDREHNHVIAAMVSLLIARIPVGRQSRSLSGLTFFDELMRRAAMLERQPAIQKPAGQAGGLDWC
ncbi:MAG: hypothetical protein ACK5Q5_11755 [Planctomycetaceae bacterium]